MRTVFLEYGHQRKHIPNRQDRESLSPYQIPSSDMRRMIKGRILLMVILIKIR